ncbi:SDR family NAD(P)-dependent oxidoreductase [Verrucomicrobium spinosum]|uniref:SDR family NAD(P)-dependent oxidoreductase n=1 Tax=Verrucomicrobium spinosum TaxID=2736 RepID=UPI0001744B20|nr:glucose 1-dehydrogenase [Verrucomicrobium spinosum]
MPTSSKLSGRTAIVTGASKGIGASIARHLAAEGASVIVNYSSSKEAADQVVAEIIAEGGKAAAVHANMSKQADIERLFAETKELYGQLDILVNNAGVYDFAPLEQITEEHFHKMFNLNVLGLILAMQESLKYFGGDGGTIVNVSSVVATYSPPNSGVYNATKSAVDGLTRTFSKELAPKKIRVNSINPGPIETEGVHAQGLTDKFREMGAALPLGRVGQPADIATGVVFLASDDSSWMTGETLYITGGLR